MRAAGTIALAALLLVGSARAQPAANSAALSDFAAKALAVDAPVATDGEAILSQALKKLWSGGVELGLAGGGGNSDVMKMRLGFMAKRDADGNVMASDFMYSMATARGTMMENKALWVLHDDVRMGQTKWGMMMAETIEFDQFRAFNFREAMHGGMTRTLFQNDRLLLRARFGSGMSYDLNTVTTGDRWVPEGMVGYELQFQATERVLIVSSGDYFPDMAKMGQFRLRIRAAGEFLIAPEYGLSLRAGIMERYDSNPGGGLRNDIDYFTTILMKF